MYSKPGFKRCFYEQKVKGLFSTPKLLLNVRLLISLTKSNLSLKYIFLMNEYLYFSSFLELQLHCQVADPAVTIPVKYLQLAVPVTQRWMDFLPL